MPRQLIMTLGLAAAILAAGSPARPDRSRPTRRKADIAAQAVADEGTGAGHGAAHAEPNILEPQPRLAIWTVVVFVGLLLVLGRFAWKPLAERLAAARGTPRTRPARHGAGAERGRAPAGRASPPDGRGPGTGPLDARGGAARGADDGRRDRPQGTRRGRRHAGARPARHQLSARPGLARALVEVGRAGGLGRRQGPRPRHRPGRASPPDRDGDERAARVARGAQRPPGELRHELRNTITRPAPTSPAQSSTTTSPR